MSIYGNVMCVLAIITYTSQITQKSMFAMSMNLKTIRFCRQTYMLRVQITDESLSYKQLEYTNILGVFEFCFRNVAH